MPKRQHKKYKDLGLELALILARYFFKTDYLHYGYWTPDLPVESNNLLRAQEQYCEMLLSHIPPGTRTILDVGCGTGKFAQELRDQGYIVDCLSPSELLTLHARNRLGDQQVIYECKYEELITDRRYDLILFSESFQYIPLVASLDGSIDRLNPGGHLLISDFFEVDAKQKSTLGGGHAIGAFYEQLNRSGYDVVLDKDITAETAPNLDLVHGLVHQVGIPIYRSLSNALSQNRPVVYTLLRWVFRKRLAKLRHRYSGDGRTAASFARFKEYRVLLCRRPPIGPHTRIAEDERRLAGAGASQGDS